MLPFAPFSALTSRIYGSMAIAALIAAGVQTVRVACRDATIAEQSATIADRTSERNQERDAHHRTKADYRHAQDAAAQLEATRLARVQLEQQEITDEVVADYRGRLAAARAAADRLRDAAPGGAGARGEGDPEPVPGTGAATSGTAPPAGDRRLSLDERLIATDQALQLDALIDWVLGQAAVEPNR